jgi:hypothetical protein
MLSDELPFLALGFGGVLTTFSVTSTRRIVLAALAAWSVAANTLVTYAPTPKALALVRELSLGAWSPLAHPFLAYPFALRASPR